MGSPLIFNGLFAKILASLGIKFRDGKTIISSSVDPTLSATDALTGSLLMNGTSVYRKNDDGSTTNWTDITASAAAATSAITIAGVTIDFTTAIVLSGYATGNTQYQTLFRNGAAYQVPVGYKLILVAVRASQHAGTDPYSIKYIGYGDNAVTSTTAPTNEVDRPCGPSALLSFNTGYAYPRVWNNAGGNWEDEGATLPQIEIPAGKYPFFRIGNNTAIVAEFLGYLEAA